MSGPALVLDGVRKVFRQGTIELTVLSGADLTLRPGEIVALVGPSGAGKSTLLHLAGLLERPDGGEIRIDGRNAAPSATRGAPCCAARHSASSISSTICCRNFPRSRT